MIHCLTTKVDAFITSFTSYQAFALYNVFMIVKVSICTNASNRTTISSYSFYTGTATSALPTAPRTRCNDDHQTTIHQLLRRFESQNFSRKFTILYTIDPLLYI